MSKRGFKNLPFSDFLLYNKIKDFVQEHTNNIPPYKRDLLENKTFLLIQVMSYELFGMPLMQDNIIAMHDGPVFQRVYQIQKDQKKVTTKAQKVDKEMLSYL